MITVEVNHDDLAYVQSKLGALREQAPKVLRDAVNKTARNARMRLAAKARERYTVKNVGFNNHVKIRRATQSKLYAELKVNGRTLTQPRFHTTRNTKRRGAKTEVIRGHGLKELVNREGNKAFFAKVATGHKNVNHTASAQDKTTNMVLQRTGDDHYPMRSFHGSSVPKMLEKVYDGRSITDPGLKKEIEAMYRRNVQDAIGKALQQ